MGKNDPTQRTRFSMLPASLHPIAATRAAGDVRLMFFLLRMAFWLGIVLILLPSGGSQHGPAASDVGASDAISAASATVHDIKGFCSREPNACTVGSELATTIGYRAQAGAKMLYEMLSEALAPHETDTLAGRQGRPDLGKAALQPASQNTLIPADLAPPWRGPSVGKGTKPSA
jgi:hypothetical protein